MFAPQVEALADAVDVVVPSLGDAASIGGMADAVLAVAPRAFALLGFSSGGQSRWRCCAARRSG